jgi:3-hydroxyacyl-CoA dehydrogenase/enoyl-CoA hydratase/3-hydroxybutyryl-CoA epimerase
LLSPGGTAASRHSKDRYKEFHGMAFFQAENLWVEIQDEAAVLRFDVAGKTLNVLNRPALTDFGTALDCIAAEKNFRRLIITSAKPTGFLAGADVHEFQHIAGPQDASALSAAGQQLFDKLEALSIPSVAVVAGPCLGGGLELALACDYRCAVEQPKTQFGLPEIKLGLLPGWGGTQRLPRTIGLERAFHVILGQRTLGARDARAWGLADAIVSSDGGPQEWFRRLQPLPTVKRSKKGLPLRTLRQKLLESTSLGRSVLFRGAEAMLKKKTPDDMPAPREAFHAIRTGIARGMSAGLAYEREAIGRLATTAACRNLVALFFEMDLAKQLPPELAGIQTKEIKRVGVVGAGAMGAGIAQLAAVRGCEVVIREVNETALAAGTLKIAALFSQAVGRGVLTQAEAQRRLATVKGTVGWDGFADVDLAVEAVIEDLELKKKVFRELEAHSRPGTLLATNTSSLVVAHIQEGLAHPERVAALHFFNPVHKMPLVEVAHAPATTPEATAALTRWAIALGKTPVVVKDSPGFIVNRILIPYLNEAVVLVREGMAAERVDEAMRRFGMMGGGPLEVIDLVGIDVAAHIGRTVQPAFADRFPPNPAFEALAQRGWLGQKSKRGFYNYAGKKKRISPEAVALVRQTAAQPASLVRSLPRPAQLREATERMVLLMVNEAAAAVGEGLVASPDLIDRAMVFGTGWAPHRGGPLRYADDRGLADVVRAMTELARRLGPRFAPCAELARRAESGQRFRSPLPR